MFILSAFGGMRETQKRERESAVLCRDIRPRFVRIQIRIRNTLSRET